MKAFHAKKVAARGKKTVIRTGNLDSSESALYTVTPGQKRVFLVLGLFFGCALFLNWHFTLEALLALVTLIYFLDVLFSMFLVYRSFSRDVEFKITRDEIETMPDSAWPSYTVFCPLYKEASVLGQFVEAMNRLEYPRDRLQILLLLEEDDTETLDEVRAMVLPPAFKTLVVPHSLPKTKPKAMNYALDYARGEFVVIYDAEDIPDPLQLKKAYLAFRKAAPNTVCVQAKLNFYNAEQNLLTKIFAAEYSLWFDLVLPGLQSFGAPIPLGGTSNHFRLASLRVLGGWDAFNVTEDCDLGIRLAHHGYATAIFDSTTWEEANSELGNWYRQRSRWVKGYIQTFLVHMRNWKAFFKRRATDFFSFQITVGGKVFAMFVNPFMWSVTLAYFLFRPQIGHFIESFFPGPVLYMGVFSFIFGNFFYMYKYMMGCAKRRFDGLIKYTLLVPFYWLGMSVAAWKAFYELILKPHYWSKTKHGLHLKAMPGRIGMQTMATEIKR